ncbi:MAG: hypothetical protein Fur0034_11360 [Desulfuromonadia bacterium]
MNDQGGSIIFLEAYRRSKRGQAILLKRLIEQHLAEIGEKFARTKQQMEEDTFPPRGSRDER